MSSPKQLARIAGVFYLLVGIFGGFAEGFVDPKLHVAGNAAATAGNVVANAELVRMGVVAHLVDGVFFALTAMALYLLLNHVHKNAARSMVIFVVIAVGMICLNAVFLFEGMQVATDPSYVTALDGVFFALTAMGDCLRGGRIECPRNGSARHPALRHAGGSSLLRPLAGAARVSRLPIWAVSQGLGSRAGARHHLLPR